jgi:hypothetical protein
MVSFLDAGRLTPGHLTPGNLTLAFPLITGIKNIHLSLNARQNGGSIVRGSNVRTPSIFFGQSTPH